nr:DUF4231 domain-containing protein [Kribbella shirazensis]
MKVADGSYKWYRSHAIRSRQSHKWTQVLLVLTSAAIPVSGLANRGGALLPSLIGAVVFILVGLRSTFHWHENYLRYSQAREAVEAERRSFHVGAPPYDDRAKRAQLLVAAVTRIEQEEMGTWLRTVSMEPKAGPSLAARPAND